MEQNTRLRINLVTREIEIEGSEAFVKEYADKFESLLSVLAQPPASPPPPAPAPNDTTGEAPAAIGLPSKFGEYLHLFSKDITDLDRMLIAGYWAQSQDPDNSFATGPTHGLLKTQGVKLANAANCVKKNIEAKKVFALEKGKFRVSKTGAEYVSSLLAKK